MGTHAIRRSAAFLSFLAGTLAIGSCFAQGAAREIAQSRPTPCLDRAVPLLNMEVRQLGVRAFLAGAGRGAKLPAGWAPGNRHYDQAFAITNAAVAADEKVHGAWLSMRPTDYLELIIGHGSAEEQQQLRSFFASPAGRMYWDFIIDGARCDGMLEGLLKRGVVLSAGQRTAIGELRGSLKRKRQQFEGTFGLLAETQKQRFHQGAQLFDRLAENEAADRAAQRMAFAAGDDAVRASMRRVNVVVNKEVLALLSAFSDSAAGTADPEKQSILERTLGAMAYAPSFKRGLLAEKQSSGRTTKFIEAALAADDRQLEAIIAGVYANYLSRQEIEELARFYESDAGKALVAQQARDALNGRPSLRLEPNHAAQAREFTNSATGKAFARVSSSQEIWAEVGAAMRTALLR